MEGTTKAGMGQLLKLWFSCPEPAPKSSAEYIALCTEGIKIHVESKDSPNTGVGWFNQPTFQRVR